MKALLTMLVLTLTTGAAMASDTCYSLYMRGNNTDPSRACAIMNPKTGIFDSMNLYMTDGSLKDVVPLESTEQIVGYRGQMALHYFILKGEGQFHIINASQNMVMPNVLTRLSVITKADGHSQRAVELSAPPKAGPNCVPGRRCI